METITIFTDGSTLNNQNKLKRRGGYGVYFGDDDSRNISESLGKSDKHTNQVAELTACIKGIEKILESNDKVNIIIYTDSNYTVQSMTNWGKKWEKNNWINSKGKVIENKELIITLYNYTKKYNIKFKHVRAHQKEPSKDSPDYFYWYGNYMADKLANLGVSKI